MEQRFTAAGKQFVSNRDQSCRMFRSDFLEFFSHVHPAAPAVVFLPVSAAMLWIAASAQQPAAAIALRFALGVLLWTLMEYLTHRYVFHSPQSIEEETRGVLSRLAPGEPAMPALPTFRHRFYFMVHGVHHDYPHDSRRLVVPPSLSIPYAAAMFLLMRVVFGSAAPAIFAGSVAAYVAYDEIHYFTHQGGVLSTYGRYLTKRHLHHHYGDSHRDFGVSSPLWDVAFGTSGWRQRRAAAQAVPSTNTAFVPPKAKEFESA